MSSAKTFFKKFSSSKIIVIIGLTVLIFSLPIFILATQQRTQTKQLAVGPCTCANSGMKPPNNFYTCVQPQGKKFYCNEWEACQNTSNGPSCVAQISTCDNYSGKATAYVTSFKDGSVHNTCQGQESFCTNGDPKNGWNGYPCTSPCSYVTCHAGPYCGGACGNSGSNKHLYDCELYGGEIYITKSDTTCPNNAKCQPVQNGTDFCPSGGGGGGSPNPQPSSGGGGGNGGHPPCAGLDTNHSACVKGSPSGCPKNWGVAYDNKNGDNNHACGKGTGTEYTCCISPDKITPSASPSPSQSTSPNPSPSQSPSTLPSVSPSNSPSANPSSSPVPSFPSTSPLPNQGAILAFTIGLHGIGNGGDNANPTGPGNPNPKHPSRTLNVSVFDISNNQLPSSPFTGQINYDSGSGLFIGTISLSSVNSGSYQIKVHVDGFLNKTLSSLISITPGQTMQVPQFALVNGDIDTSGQSNNALDILDYSAIVSCFGSKQSQPSCQFPPGNTPGADIDDDGVVGGSDYNLLLREFSVQSGG